MRSGVAVQWRIPDELWQRIEPLLPRRWWKRSKKGGRPRVPARQVMDGIFYVLRTGIQWKAVPPEFGAGSTLHAYCQELVQRKVFRRLWKVALTEYDELKGIQWDWQSIDGTMTKAPLGGEKNRPQSNRSGQSGDQTLAAH